MSGLKAWIADLVGHPPADLAPYQQALTHPSFGPANYQRLEFLGDRVLGLIIAEWLAERFPHEPEGQLSHRLTTLVSRATCAEVGNAIGVPAQLRLGKQAREDGAKRSDNVVGDAVEALIAAIYLDHGIEGARAFIRQHWLSHVGSTEAAAPRHPKSLLHEYAEGKGGKPPSYEVVGRRGPSHAPTFTVRASVRGLGEAEAEGNSKQEAETAAAAALLEKIK